MPRLTDTQLIILSAASQRDDRGVELPTNGKGEAARKAVDKLIRAGLLEEVRSSGSLPVWRRDDETGPMALCITKKGLEEAVRYPCVKPGHKTTAPNTPTRARARVRFGPPDRLSPLGEVYLQPTLTTGHWTGEGGSRQVQPFSKVLFPGSP